MLGLIQGIHLRFQRIRKSLAQRIKPWLLEGKSPATRLTLKTARKEWRLIAINFVSSIFEALTEGATLGIIFLAVELLSGSGSISWKTKPLAGFLAWLPNITQLPTKYLFLILLILALLLQALQSFSKYTNLVTTSLFGARVYSVITSIIHTQILSLTFACSSRYRVGDLLNTVSSSPRAVEAQITQISAISMNIILAVCYLSILLALSPWLLLAAVVLGVALTQFQSKLVPAIKRLSLKAVEANVEVSAKMTQDIQGLRLIHTAGLTQESSEQLDQNISAYEGFIRRQAFISQALIPLTSFLPILGISLIAGLSAILFGTKSTGVLPSLVTFVLALQRLNMRFSAIAGCFNTLAANAGSVERLDLLLKTDDKEFRRLGGMPFHGLLQSIELRDVSLRYSPQNPLVLSHINLVIPKGRTVALVGSSGSGKSSLADLLVGLYDTTAGNIYIDSVSLQDYDLSSWQKHIGVVSQDTFLFNASLTENIAYGSFNCSQADVIRAAELAQADRFIKQLPMGFETIVGERGYKLSGGQRQRISLARALLKKPDFLILDEATSALDSRNERLVQSAIEQLSSSITILIIAHRLSTIVKADLICVMESGRIVEQGDHETLMHSQGKYYQLWQQQAHSVQTGLALKP